MVSEEERSEGFRPVGDRLGKFVILSELGRGSMGVVYEAFQEDLKRKVALKILPANIALDAKQVQRFHREAESAARLNHPSVIQIYEVGRIQGTDYFAMELIDGVCFGEDLSRDREGIDEAARIARDAALGLAHAHERGVVHRDVKPSNVLVERTGRVVLTDFGLARITESGSLTSTDAIVGTPKYMSPEQILRGARRIDGRSDIYSLGAALYEVVAGRPVFDEPSAQAFIKAILEQQPGSPRRSNRAVPHDLATIILRCLEKEPGERYATAADLAADLTRYLAGERIVARPKSVAARGFQFVRRHKVLSGLAATAVVGIAAAVVLGGMSVREAEKGRLLEQIAEIRRMASVDQALGRAVALAREHPDAEGVERLVEDLRVRVRMGELRRMAGRGSTQEALVGAHQLWEENVEDERVGELVRELHARRAEELLQAGDKAAALSHLEAAGRTNGVWYPMLLVEARLLDQAQELAAGMPERDPVRPLLLARLAIDDHDFHRALDLLENMPTPPRGDDRRAFETFWHLARGLAHYRLALALERGDAVSGTSAAEELAAAVESFKLASESAQGLPQEWLRARSGAYQSDAERRRGGSAPSLDELATFFGGTGVEAFDFLNGLWKRMTRRERKNLEHFVDRVLAMADEEKDLPRILEERAAARMMRARTPRETVVAALLVAAANFTNGLPQDAREVLETAEGSAVRTLEPYVLWGRSLASRALGERALAMELSRDALQAAARLGDFPDVAPLVDHALLLAEEAKREGDGDFAIDIAYSVRALRDLFQEYPEVREKLPPELGVDERLRRLSGE